jgi:putative phosphoribosyl transferase
MRFTDRTEAGERLAFELARRGYPDPVVLALPRGGVPVAVPIARALHAPLDLVMVRKIGLPMQPEVAVGAVVNGDNPVIVVNDDIALASGLDHAAVTRLAAPQIAEIKRRRAIYLSGRTAVPLTGRTVILVDDGLATGASMRAALRAVAPHHPARRIVALPVSGEQGLADLAADADETICLLTPLHFYAVGAHYDNFDQVTDAEVTAALHANDPAKENP